MRGALLCRQVSLKAGTGVAIARTLWRVGAPTYVALLMGLSSTSARAQTFSDPQPAKATLAIVGGHLIDGFEGPPRHNSLILIDGKEIVAVGTTESLKVPAGAKVIDAAGYTVMPGLIDAHVHTDHLAFVDYPAWHRKYNSANKNYDRIHEIAVKQLLLSGVTTAVDLGGDADVKVRIRDRINRGELVGSRMIMSNGWIWNVADSFAASYYRRFDNWYLNVHTADEARAAAQKIIAKGADIIKLYTGLTADQVKAITEEAHKKGLRVTGHATGDADLIARVRAGQDAIEHLGFNPDNEEVIRELVERRIAVVPTNIRTLWAPLAAEVPGWLDNPRVRALTPPDLWAEIRPSLAQLVRTAQVRPRRIDERGKVIKKLHDAGVRLLVGTDMGDYHTDAAWREMELFVRFGIPAMEVISAATRYAAEHVGLGDKLGTIAPGKLADIIVVDGNPLKHMEALRHVVHVIKDGQAYRGVAHTDFQNLAAAPKTNGQP